MESWSAWPAPTDGRRREELSSPAPDGAEPQEALPAAALPAPRPACPARSARCPLPGSLSGLGWCFSSAPFSWAFYRLSRGLDLAVSLPVGPLPGGPGGGITAQCVSSDRQWGAVGGSSGARPEGFSFSSKTISTPSHLTPRRLPRRSDAAGMWVKVHACWPAPEPSPSTRRAGERGRAASVHVTEG